MKIDKAILKLLKRSSSLEELEILEDWKKQSEENLAFLSLINTPMNNNYELFDTKNAWKKIARRAGINSSINKSLITGIIIALSALLTSLYFVQKSAEVKALPVYEPETEVRAFALVDDSKVWLNKNSMLAQVSDFSEDRIVKLQGEAYFDVSHKEGQSFIIQLNDEDFVRVVGTSFNLLNTEEEFDLNVYSGKVELHTLNRVIELEKGFRAVRLDETYVKLRNRDKNVSSWKSNELIFEDAFIDNVFQALERHYKLDIHLKDGLDTGGCKLRSRFKNQDIDEIFTELSEIWSMAYTRTGQTIEISDIACR